MKAKYLYSAMAATVLALALTACSNENDMPEPEQKLKETTPITLSTDTVKVGVGESSTFNITAGGGDYKLIVENPDVASATIAGNVVIVKSAVKGKTGIIISDATGNYKRVIVKSMYFKMTLNKEVVNITMKLGHTDGTAEVTVTGGNGNYKAVSNNTKVADVQFVKGDVITIRGVANGSTDVIVTDMMGLKQTVKVQVETTDVAFTEEEKAKIMASTNDGIFFDNDRSSSWGTMGLTKDNGMNLAQWDFYGNCIKCWFSGDLTVGKKSDGKVLVNDPWSSNQKTYENVNVEIIKVDGSRVWGIMYLIKDNYLHSGYFCLKKAETEIED